MKTGYLVSGHSVAEFTYEKEAPKTLMGCKLVGVVYGGYVYVSSRVDKCRLFPTLESAKAYIKERIERSIAHSQKYLRILESELKRIQE